MFNVKPKDGLAFLQSAGIISPDPKDSGTPEENKTKAIARFLKQSVRLDKKLLGEFISRPDQTDLLKAFIQLFDFSGVSVTTPDFFLLQLADKFVRNRLQTP